MAAGFGMGGRASLLFCPSKLYYIQQCEKRILSDLKGLIYILLPICELERTTEVRNMSDLKLVAVRKEVVAYLMDCPSESFLAYKDKGDDGFVVIAPTGQKYTFSVKQLEQGLIAMDLDRAAKAVEQARARPEPPAEPLKAEPEPEPPAMDEELEAELDKADARREVKEAREAKEKEALETKPTAKKKPARKRTTRKKTKE
jgi:hypothetical protein